MNERIKELKQQARDFYLLQEDLDCSTKQLHELVESKFAELIVKECADIVADAVDHREPASTYVEKIKEHFGVEE